MKTSYSIVPFNDKYAPYITYIRHCVFTIEQEIDSSEDLDGKDPQSIHVLAKVEDHFVGTARMMLDGHIGRLALLKDFRNRNIGSNMILSLITEAKKRNLDRVYLGAQCVAASFYHKLGFKEYGDVFQEVGIDHIMMKKTI